MMSPLNRRKSDAALRFAERRQREEEAPRLCKQVPGLVTLQLDIEERTAVMTVKHTRRIVVDRAPALFLVPCGDSRCADEHDLTAAVMRALRAGQTSFEGSYECSGTVGTSVCTRVVHFDAVAQYRT
jgi:hypothetical protein